MVEKSDLLISQFQNLLNYCPSVIFSFNYQDCLKINFISENLKAILGYTPSKFISNPQSWFDYVHPDDLQLILSQLPILLEKGSIATDYRFKHVDGTYRWLYEEKRVIYDHDGQPIEIIGSWTDISERKIKDVESEEKYRIITEQLLIGVAIIQDNVFKYVNQRYAEIGGYTVEEMINWQSGEFINTVYPDDREMVMEQSIKKQHGDEDVITQYIFRGLTKTSEKIWVELYSKTITYEGRPAVLITLIDITSRKQAELKLKKSEEKYREAYEIASFFKDLFAHDINNILNNISMSSKLSTMALNNPANLSIIEEYLNIINEQVNKGAALISNVRILSEIDDSKISIQPTKLHYHLNESISSTKKAYHDRNINIHLKLYDRKVIVEANSLLEEVFVNILNNAVNYNENPLVEILVKTSKEQKYKQNYIKIEFMDNGIGISDPQKELIFKKRCREHKGGKGMGFGLTLVKKIVDSYKGEIWVEDKVKGDHTKGSNFVLLLPLVG